MEKPLRVADNFRTSEYSKQEGGCTVVVEYKDGRIFEYDKIKSPKAYIRKILENTTVSKAYIKI
jgi:hypothetical protein